jgi:predicted HicB family RNase H-like nuclease
MKNQINYKGYIGQISVDMEDDCLYVEVINAKGMHNLAEGRTPSEVKAAFESMIDDYLTACEVEGWTVIEPMAMVSA